jgi:hypothetical protein
MRNKVLAAAFVVLLYAQAGFGQTSADVEMKYGKTETVHSVSEHLWMTPEYDADGRVCMMRLYSKRVAPGINYLDDGLDIDETLKFINELIPPDTRGKRKESFGTTSTGGGVAWTHFGYERAAFTFVSTFEFSKLLDRPDELLSPDWDEKSLAEARREEALRPDDELICERTGKPKVLEVRWADRKCVGP